MSFDLTKLQPGDEVGATWDTMIGRKIVAVYRVVAIHDDGVIETDQEDLFGPDGHEIEVLINGRPSPHQRRLCEPTEEGRCEMLRESLGVDFDILGGRTKEMDLEKLRRLRIAVAAMAEEFEVEL